MIRWIVVVSCACLLTVALVAWLAYGLKPASSAAGEPAIAHAAMSAAISDSLKPKLTVAGHVGGDATAVAVQGSYAYVGFGLDFTVLDVSDPTRPARAGYLLMSKPIPAADRFCSQARWNSKSSGR